MVKLTTSLPSMLLLCGLVVLTAFTESAKSQTVGAYAVGNHDKCGVTAIPGTIRELDKFFASSSLPSTMEKNFYWKDADVHQEDWTKDGDYQSSSDTETGYNGADASLLTYIASHGVTRNAVYTAYAGTKEHGGCKISSNKLNLGDQDARYLILSTCQGLKIGGYDGDYPASDGGENPSKTWKDSAVGLNCIFGYSNNMADKDSYGEYLLKEMKAGKPLSEAFLTASEGVSKSNIPAVLCYGSDKEDAENYLKTNKEFEEESRDHTESAWVYRKSSSSWWDDWIAKAATKASSTLSLKPINLTTFTNKALKTVAEHYDAETNLLSMKFPVSMNKGLAVSTEAAREQAEALLNASGLKQFGNFVLSSTAEDVLGFENGTQKILNHRFRFQQDLGGLKSLGQAGSIEIVIQADGSASELKASLFEVMNRSKKMTPAWTPKSQESMEEEAIKRVAQRIPNATYTVVSKDVGYDIGNHYEYRLEAPAVAEIIVEAGRNGVARRYIEKIEL